MMYNVFESLLKKKGISAYQLSKETGISNSTLSDWKNGKSAPKNDKLSIIADYFCVSVDFLLGKEADPVRKESAVERFSKSGVKFALHGEVEDLTEEDAEMLLDMVKILKERKKGK